MTAKKDAAVIFTDGYVKSKDWVIIVSELASLADEDVELTRIFTFKAGVWRHFDFDGWSIRSICGISKPDARTYYLAKDGRIKVKTLDGWAEEAIADAGNGEGKYGYVNRIREIGGHLFVCGVAGQVYLRERSGWVHFDEGILANKTLAIANTFYGIAGNSRQDMYLVGRRGLVCHYGGKSWQPEYLPTSETLRGVCCVSPDEVYICGRNGSFFKGRKSNWINYSIPKADRHFWSVEVFREKIYVAASDGLYVFDEDKVKPLETGLKPVPDGNRLHANEGVLWSFGVEHLCSFDGKKWTYVKHPDNE